MGTLYIVSTPIGNLQDLTFRASEILKKVEIIACEDTRRTRILLNHVQANQKPTLLSYYEQNEFQRIPRVLNVLKNGIDVALVSDSGTPTISDPGFKLVRECVRLGIKVESIPGPCSVISSLVVSGLPTDKFLFLGYLPKKEGKRIKFLNNLLETQRYVKSTAIIFEAPHRLLQTLEEIKSVFGDIQIVTCRELTKVHEEVRREKISETIDHFTKFNPKGEIILLFN